MDLPKPPSDKELRNIIDKLAQFVARNGPEFEQMTKNKQKDNPKFSFLFGGEFYHYYNYKVNAEQAILRQKGACPQFPSNRAFNSGGGNNANRGSWQQQSDPAPWVAGPPPPPPQQQPPPDGGASSNTAVGASSQLGAHVLPQPPPPQPPPPSRRPRPLMEIQMSPPPPPNISSSPPAQPLLPPASTVPYKGQPLAELRELLSQLNTQQETLKDQIAQSESNLRAQKEVTAQKIDALTKETIRKAQYERLELLASDTGLSLDEMSVVMQPIVESCTKDSISSGKSWIFSNATSHDNNQLIAHYLSFRITEEEASFSTKLHLTYLMNDVLHHCVRKNAEELKQSLESVSVEIFCAASVGCSAEQQAKLDKLINLWEQKSIFSSSTLSKMRQPAVSYQAYKDRLKEDYASEIEAAVGPLKTTLESYKSQHQNFFTHANSNIQAIETQKAQILEQISQAEASLRQPPTPTPPPPPSSLPPPLQQQQQPQPQPWVNNEGPGRRDKPSRGSRWDTGDRWAQTSNPTPPQQQPPPATQPQQQQPLAGFPPPQVFPDLSRPPPGFNPGLPPPGLPPPAVVVPPSLPPQQQQQQQQQQQPPQPAIDELIPSIPYYDLPTGLMVPLVKIDESGYRRPIDPAKIRLPPPTPPTERLLIALESFYAQPSHEHPRDPEGWEILGLYEWQREKQSQIEKKKNDIESGYRERSPTCSPEPYSTTLEEAQESSKKTSGQEEDLTKGKRKKRLYRSRSRTRSRSGSRESTPEQSPTRSSSSRSRQRRSKSRSPVGSYSMPSYLTKRSPSPVPPSRGGGRSQKNISPPPSPPDEKFVVGFETHTGTTPPPSKLDSSNKGHQMMQRMGWKTGTGLGSGESGIVEPIASGEVRERKDLYKGVGVPGSKSDPFEAFRKNKAGSFYTRIKERAESRK